MLLYIAQFGRGRRGKDGLIWIFVVGGDWNPSCAPQPPCYTSTPPPAEVGRGGEGDKRGCAGPLVLTDTP